jgi:hypothetical protein
MALAEHRDLAEILRDSYGPSVRAAVRRACIRSLETILFYDAVSHQEYNGVSGEALCWVRCLMWFTAAATGQMVGWLERDRVIVG